MWHPFVTRAMNKGAYSAFVEAGSEGSDDYMYDATIHQEYDATLMSMTDCVFHCPNTHDRIKTFKAPNVGTGGGSTTGSRPMIWTNLPAEGSNPQEGPDTFDKRGFSQIDNPGILTEHASQEVSPIAGWTKNYVGLTSYLTRTFIVWYKMDDYTTADGGVIVSYENEANDDTTSIRFRLRPTNLDPQWEIGGTIHQPDCANEPYAGLYCNNTWHMSVLTIDIAGRIRIYQDGRECYESTSTLPTFPTTPTFRAFFNRTSASSSAGFTDYQLGPVSVANGQMSSENIAKLWRSMWRLSDAQRTSGTTVQQFKDAPEQNLRRSDMRYVDRIKGGATLGGALTWRDNDNISFGGDFRFKNRATDGFSVFCMQQLAGVDVGEDTPKVKYIDTINDSGSYGYKCCYAVVVDEYFTYEAGGIRIERDNQQVNITAYGATTGKSDGGQLYSFSSASSFLNTGSGFSGLGEYRSFAVSLSAAKGALYVNGESTETDQTVSPAALHLPTHAPQFDNPTTCQSIGKNNAISDNGEDHSVYGPYAYFDTQLSLEDVRELESICNGQAPLRSRRPTRGLLRQTGLMAPGRIME